MNDAIKLAIEKGGYNASLHIAEGDTLDLWLRVGDWRDYEYEIICDKDFWQALGKALGWNYVFCGTCGIQLDHCRLKGHDQEGLPEWLAQAEHYMRLVFTGGSTEKFWKELLIQ